MVNIGSMYAAGNGVKQDQSTAFAWYKMAADGGFHRGITSLAFMYETGQGTTKNLDEATRLDKLAAADGDPDAAFALRRLATGSPTGSTMPPKIDFSAINGLNSNIQPVTVNVLTSTPIGIAGHTIDIVTTRGKTTITMVYGNAFGSSKLINGDHKDLVIVQINRCPAPTECIPGSPGA